MPYPYHFRSKSEFAGDRPEKHNQVDSLAIIRAVISLGKNLAMTVTAEGVETNDHLGVIREECSDEVQEFLFSRLMPLQETHRLMGLIQSSMSVIA